MPPSEKPPPAAYALAFVITVALVLVAGGYFALLWNVLPGLGHLTWAQGDAALVGVFLLGATWTTGSRAFA